LTVDSGDILDTSNDTPYGAPVVSSVDSPDLDASLVYSLVLFSRKSTMPECNPEPMPKFLELLNALKKIPSRTLFEWHLALAHLGRKKILNLADMGLISVKDPNSPLDCHACAAAKMSRKPFAKSMPPKADNIGEAYYSDVCGKISPPTLFGEQYIVSFTDEKSGHISVFLLKKKNEVFSKFKEVLALSNNQNNTTSVKVLVSDGGGEYIDGMFEEYLKENGIVHCKTPPNTPQRNGKSERLNRILFDLARAMLRARRMPLRFWGEAVLYAAYIINRTPKIGNDQTRHEMLFGRKPLMHNVLEFGTPVMYHNHDPHIKKLHDRAFDGIFLGFFEKDHTYKIFSIKDNMLVSTRSISSYPQKIADFEENDWEEKFFAEDDDYWLSGLTEQPQYQHFNQYQLPNNQCYFNNNFNNNNINNDYVDPNHIINDQINNDLNDNNNRVINVNNDNVLNNNDYVPMVISEESYFSDDDAEDIMGNPINPPQQVPVVPIRTADPVPNVNDQVVPILADHVPLPNVNNQPAAQIEIEDDEENDYPRISSRLRSKEHQTGSQVLSLIQIEKILDLAEIETPSNYKQAMNSPDAATWKEAVKAEHKSLVDNGTFKVVNRPIGKKTITSRHVFKVKTDDTGAVSKFKARLVARGFLQTKGVDYFENFSPTLRADSLRYLIATAARLGMKAIHLDVETAFLNGKLSEEIYMEIPEGWEGLDRKTQVFLLLKSIYGLKQASRIWNELFTEEIKGLGYIQSAADPCIFIKYDNNGNPIAFIGIFVDDCIVIGGEIQINEVRTSLMKLFKMHDLGPLKFALGIKFDQDGSSIKMSQSLYVDNLLEKFGMQDCRIVDTPLPEKCTEADDTSALFPDINLYQQMVGSLIYLSNSTRPDIAHAVSFIARKMHAPTEASFTNAKRVLRYLKGTRNYALNFNNKSQPLHLYSDSSYAETISRKSVGGYVTLCAGAAITWKSTKQPIIAQSSMEAEYIALAEAAKEAEWLRKLEVEIFPKLKPLKPTLIYEDNHSAIKLTNNPIHSNRSKHIDVRYHKIQELVANKVIVIEYKPTADMVADIMTKSLGKTLHARFVDGMGIIDLSKK
jgi:hypothetical protein